MLDSEFKATVKEIIVKFHKGGLPRVFNREIEVPVLKKANKVFSIIGPRRAGKTYFLYNIMQKLMFEGKKIEEFLYLNFEDYRLEGIKKQQLELILESYKELYGEKKPLLFFDEIQNVSGWEKFVRRLNDAGYVIYVTGSNSRLLSMEIATSLRGRNYSIQVLPFSFQEFLKIRGVKLSKNWEFDGTKTQVIKFFKEFFELSGFPEIVLEKKIEFIDEYFKTMLYRDAVERYKIKNTELLLHLMKYLTRQYAHEYSINKFNNFAKSSGFKSSTSVIQKYSKILQDIYFCFFVNAKQKSFKKESSYSKKAFLADHGFINYYNTEKDKGRILENIVFTELVRKKIVEINYYKNGFECDFITKENCIQVCYSLTEENRKRELTGLTEAVKKFGKKPLILTFEQEEIIDNKIQMIPVWKWLLQEQIIDKQENQSKNSGLKQGLKKGLKKELKDGIV